MKKLMIRPRTLVPDRLLHGVGMARAVTRFMGPLG